MINSKKGGFFFTFVLILIGIVMLVIIIGRFVPIVGEAGGELLDLFPEEQPEFGTQFEDESCVSNWDCGENLVCIDNKCVAAQESFFIYVYGKVNCRNSFDKFIEKGLEGGADLKHTFSPGTYQLEIKPGKIKDGGSGYIDKGGDTTPAQNKFYVGFWPENSTDKDDQYLLGTPFILDEGKNRKYYMVVGTPHKLDFTQNVKMYAWVPDTDCDGNKGYVAIRVDKDGS